MKIKNEKVSLAEIKQALLDERFRNTLPDSFSLDVGKFLQNPGCGCNVPLYNRIIKEASDQLKQYFPNRSFSTEELKNSWSVINCNVEELAQHLHKLPPGRKQISVARYADQVTVVINELDS